MQGNAQDRRNWAIAIAGVVLAGLILRWRAFSPFEISHADELMQYLEQARRIATGHGIVPWEYRLGVRNGLIPQLLAVPWWLGEKLAPGTLVPMLATRWSFMALTLLTLPAAWLLGALHSRRHALLALFVAALWYESVLFSALLLSEVLATGVIALAAALLLHAVQSGPEVRDKTLRWAGFLLGLGVLVRLQYAPFAAVLALATLRLDWRGWGQLVLGGLIAAAIGALSDLGMGQVPYAWVLQNFSYNIDAGRAARFGTSGPFEYVLQLLAHLGPAAVFIIAGAVAVPRQYRPLVWALAVNLLFHSLIAHKEYRFVWLSTFLIVVLAAITSVTLLDRFVQERRGGEPGRLPLVLLCLLWLALSVAAERNSGGARTMRGGAPIPVAALAGAQRAETCGIVLPNQWRAHLVTALLPREVPLYIAPEEVVARGETLPPELAAAANALVFTSRPKGGEAYRVVSCKANTVIRACLYVRDGGCKPSARWTYQAALEREGL